MSVSIDNTHLLNSGNFMVIFNIFTHPVSFSRFCTVTLNVQHAGIPTVLTLSGVFILSQGLKLAC